MPEEINKSRQLAPDTKWILTSLGTGLLIVIAVTQYQIDRAAELTLERARSGTITQKALNEAFRPRDKRITSVENQLTKLREERARIGEGVSNIDKTMARIVEVTIQTQSRAAETEGQLKQLLNQTAANAQLVNQLIDRHRQSAHNVSERLTRLESQRLPVTPSGTP